MPGHTASPYDIKEAECRNQHNLYLVILSLLLVKRFFWNFAKNLLEEFL